MDTNAQRIWSIKLDKLAQKLRDNNMEAHIASSIQDLQSILDKLILDGSSVCTGGSMTLEETGTIDYLRVREVILYDKEEARQAGVSALADMNRQAFSVDNYITSTNAITKEGWLYNVDANGNRVAAMMYGPKNVIVICGRNKWVADVDEAEKRIAEYASPVNCARLARKTPCVHIGSCQDCDSPDRICNMYTIIRKIPQKNRIKVILLNFDAGY